MKGRKRLIIALTGLVGWANYASSQVPMLPGVGLPGIAPGPMMPTPPKTLFGFLGIGKEQKEFCLRKLCKTPLGQLLNNSTLPLQALSGGLIPPFCPITPTIADLADPGAVGAASKIMLDEAQAKARRAAVRYLGTVDCHYWPEAEEALIGALRGDRNECVRYEAALALGSGCCCTKKTIESLSIVVSCSDRDGAPKETSQRVHAAARLALDHCMACFQPPAPPVIPVKPKGEGEPEGEKDRKDPLTPPVTPPTTDQAAEVKPAGAIALGEAKPYTPPGETKPMFSNGVLQAVAKSSKPSKRPVGFEYYALIAQTPLPPILAEARRVAAAVPLPSNPSGERSLATMIEEAKAVPVAEQLQAGEPIAEVVSERPTNLWDLLASKSIHARPVVTVVKTTTPAATVVNTTPPPPLVMPPVADKAVVTKPMAAVAESKPAPVPPPEAATKVTSATVTAPLPPPPAVVEDKPAPVVVTVSPPPPAVTEAKPTPVSVTAPTPPAHVEDKPAPVVAAAPPPPAATEAKPTPVSVTAPTPPAVIEDKPAPVVVTVSPPAPATTEAKPTAISPPPSAEIEIETTPAAPPVPPSKSPVIIESKSIPAPVIMASPSPEPAGPAPAKASESPTKTGILVRPLTPLKVIAAEKLTPRSLFSPSELAKPKLEITPVTKLIEVSSAKPVPKAIEVPSATWVPKVTEAPSAKPVPKAIEVPSAKPVVTAKPDDRPSVAPAAPKTIVVSDSDSRMDSLPPPAPAQTLAPQALPTLPIAPPKPPTLQPATHIVATERAQKVLVLLHNSTAADERLQAITDLEAADLASSGDLVEKLLNTARRSKDDTERKACIQAMVRGNVAQPEVFATLGLLSKDPVGPIRVEATIAQARLRMAATK